VGGGGSTGRGEAGGRGGGGWREPSRRGCGGFVSCRCPLFFFFFMCGGHWALVATGVFFRVMFHAFRHSFGCLWSDGRLYCWVVHVCVCFFVFGFFFFFVTPPFSSELFFCFFFPLGAGVWREASSGGQAWGWSFFFRTLFYCRTFLAFESVWLLVMFGVFVLFALACVFVYDWVFNVVVACCCRGLL